MKLEGGASLGHLTYCTNIHPGETWPDVAATLRRHLPEIKRQVAPERAFESVDGRHDHGVDHLLVELRVAFGRRKTVLGEDVGVVEVDGSVKAAAGRIEVHDFDVLPDRARSSGSHGTL